jgi:hypothetical protein
VAGFGLGPRAFEFRAWPQPTYDGTVADVVARSADEAAEVPVVAVRRPERAGTRDGALAVRGRDARRRGGPARPELSVRSESRRGESRGRRGRGRGRGDAAEATTPVPDVVIVPDAPTPVAPDAPPSESEEPAQLAELAEPQSQPVMRPDAGDLSDTPQHRARDHDGEVGTAGLVEVDAEALVEGVDRLLDPLLTDTRDDDRRGRPHDPR